MTENRITVEGTSYIFNDLRLGERVPCQVCGNREDLLEKRLLLVKDYGRTEIFYCFDCWNKRDGNFSWIGVHCLYAFTASGLNGSPVINDIIHRAFGMPFDFLHPVEAGIFLCGNQVKCEQPSLF